MKDLATHNDEFPKQDEGTVLAVLDTGERLLLRNKIDDNGNRSEERELVVDIGGMIFSPDEVSGESEKFDEEFKEIFQKLMRRAQQKRAMIQAVIGRTGTDG